MYGGGGQLHRGGTPFHPTLGLRGTVTVTTSEIWSFQLEENSQGPRGPRGLPVASCSEGSGPAPSEVPGSPTSEGSLRGQGGRPARSWRPWLRTSSTPPTAFPSRAAGALAGVGGQAVPRRAPGSASGPPFLPDSAFPRRARGAGVEAPPPPLGSSAEHSRPSRRRGPRRRGASPGGAGGVRTAAEGP